MLPGVSRKEFRWFGLMAGSKFSANCPMPAPTAVMGPTSFQSVLALGVARCAARFTRPPTAARSPAASTAKSET